MTDLELLKLAYKAFMSGADLADDKDMLRRWNPLTNDGDALRLAVKLHIDVLHRFVGGQRVEALAPGGPLQVEQCDQKTRQAATRRAIVRATAEIGKAMP